MTERTVPNVQIRAEKLPAGDWSWNRAALQWTDWIVDEFIVRRAHKTELTHTDGALRHVL